MNDEEEGYVELDADVYGGMMIEAALRGITMSQLASEMMAEWRRLGRPGTRKPWGGEEPIEY